MSPPPARIPRASLLYLAVLVLFTIWWRAYTFGPTIRDALGVSPYWSVADQSEPLDCDEAIYAYIGHVMRDGGTLYVDASENKPPLGYLIYRMAVAVGGYEELAIRALPIPFVVATLVLVWWISRRMAGEFAAGMAALLYSLVSCDPSLYGNGAQLEQFMNLGLVACLAFLLQRSPGWNRPWVLMAGFSLGLSVLVKQIALLPILPASLYLLVNPGWDSRRFGSRLADVGTFAIGIAAPIALAVGWLLATGSLAAAHDDIIVFGSALATDTLPDPSAPSPLFRWLTGNADPAGELPPPFGSTQYLVWWAGGTWPFWLVSAVAALRLLFPGYSADRLLLLGWIAAAWGMVAAPGLYWAHYYLLPVPASAISVGVLWADLSTGEIGAKRPGRLTRAAAQVAVGVLLLGLGGLQVRHYLMSTPVQLTERFKGGRQWVVLREQARAMRDRTADWDNPRLLVWGWQSPLYFYGRFDAASRHAFTNNLMRDHAGTAHPVVGPRIRELMDDLRHSPPEFIATGYPPFDELQDFLGENYLPSRYPGAVPIWVRRDLWARYETETVSTQVGRWRRVQARSPHPSR